MVLQRLVERSTCLAALRPQVDAMNDSQHKRFNAPLIQGNILMVPYVECTLGYLNDLFELDTDSLQWTDLSTPYSGNPPSSRYWTGFTSLGEILFVFGGYTGSSGELTFSCCTQSMISLLIMAFRSNPLPQ